MNSVPVPRRMDRRGPVTLDATIRNVGPVAAGRFFASLYVSRDDVLSFEDAYLAFCDFDSGLAASATAGCAGTVKFEPAGSVPPGSYRLILHVDVGLEVDEGNEHDNFTATVGTIVVK